MHAIPSAASAIAVLAFVAAAAGPARAATPFLPIPGPQLSLLGTAAPTLPVQFDVILPLQNTAALASLLAAQENPGSPQFHQWLSPTTFAARFGPSPLLMAAVASTLRFAGLQVTVQSRSLHVSGTAAAVNAAFGTTLALAQSSTGLPRPVLGGPLTLPPVLASANAIVTAFSNSGLEARPFMRNAGGGYMRNAGGGYGLPAASTSPPGGLFFDDLKQAYAFPSYQLQVPVEAGGTQRLDGTGATVAVVMSSDVQNSDVAALFTHDGFTAASGQAANPAVFARRPVNGGATFSASNPESEEATIDVEQVLGAAPGAHLILYDTPDLSDQSLISAYTAIDNDDTADVVSSSLGQCELYYTAAYNNGTDQTALLRTYSELFEQGNAEGITFIAASGDGGGLGCLNTAYFNGGSGGFVPGVSVPAADPSVTAVGGTNLAGAANGNGGTSWTENAWSDPEQPYDPLGLGQTVSGGVWGAGGGLSTLYAQPTWQSGLATGSGSNRAVPDIAEAMGGCPDIATEPCNGGGSAADGNGNTARSYLNIVFNGDWDAVVGTSAAAPAFAGAVALLVEKSGRQGNLNPTLYALASGNADPFNGAIAGFNGVVANGGNGWSATTGLGTPNVSALLGLSGAATAGSDGTPSNP